MDRLDLHPSEAEESLQLVDEVHHKLIRDSELFLDELNVYAHDLPLRVRQALNAFRLERLSGTLIVSGSIFDQEELGSTPSHWRHRQDDEAATRVGTLLLLFASLLGDSFGWATQQDGKLIHDVVPIRGHEDEQLGSSSRALLTWHTEDAFHPLRADFLIFACVRNPYSAATTIGAIDGLELPPGAEEILFEDRFCIKPDESHLAYNNSEESDVDFSEIERWNEAPDRIAVLFGDRNQPYVRADPYFMSVPARDGDAAEALRVFVEAMDARMHDLHLAAGDYCFIDNFRTVHGRKPFTARQDGTDRWLKRVNVTRDLRKSRHARGSAFARVVH